MRVESKVGWEPCGALQGETPSHSEVSLLGLTGAQGKSWTRDFLGFQDLTVKGQQDTTNSLP